MGFAPGIREDYTYQIKDLPNVDLPVIFMDNDFEDPDLNRYLERFEKYEPSIAVLGDAYQPRDAEQLNLAAREILEEHRHKQTVVVPKCREAFDILDEDITLGYPNGYSDLKPEDYSTISDWRGRPIHILGGSPEEQWKEIQKLTQPNLTGDPPADIKGVDWNGFQKIAYLGEYYSTDGWKRADHLTIRETVRKSLEEIKAFWQEKDVWPGTTPRNLYGPAVVMPDSDIFMDTGGNPIQSREDVEAAYVQDYQNHGTLAFASETEKNHWEHYEDLDPV